MQIVESQKRLIDVFPTWMLGGIFTALNDYDVPWKDEDIAILLDYEYYGNVSGDKLISPLVEKMLASYTSEVTELSTEDINILAQIIYTINAVNWTKLYATLSLEYDPIENYSMREVMEDDETVTEYGKDTTRTDNLTYSKTGNELERPNLSNTKNVSVYGFNSNSSVPSDSESDSATGTNTTEYDIHESNGGTVRNLDSGSDTQTRNYTLTRSGNIGVTTAQQMIESERNLWLWNFFRNVVFPNVDEILAIKIY